MSEQAVPSLAEQWQLLTVKPPEVLNPAIHQLHHAAQLLAMGGKWLLPERPDDSQTNLEWLEDEQVHAGHWLLENELRLGLYVPGLRLLLLGHNNEPLAALELAGKTMEEAFGWMKQALAKAGVATDPLRHELHYEIPNHPLANGASFETLPPHHLEEMARYRTNGLLLFEAIRKEYESASDIRTWPHHYDMGVHIPLGSDVSVSAGWAICDGSYAESYLYITMWPYPNTDELEFPPLPGGHWHTQGWVGGVLKVADLVKLPTAEEQSRLALEFLQEGLRNEAHFMDL